MRILIVDDEPIVLKRAEVVVGKVVAGAEIQTFTSATEAVGYAKDHVVDIAFLDINMRVINGIALAKMLQEINPQVNIVFCTGYMEYSMEALDLHCSSYLLKPITEEKVVTAMEHLRYAVREKERALHIQCFGGFEVFYRGKPVNFAYNKTKELLAFLVDRLGTDCRTREIMAAIFEDEDKMSYYQNLRYDLLKTLKALGVEDVIREKRGSLAINRDLVSCDYYDYLDGRTRSVTGEYMPQYEFVEFTRARLAFGK